MGDGTEFDDTFLALQGFKVLAVTPAQADPSAVHLDEEEHVEAPQQHRVDGEEIAGQHRRRLASEKLGPRRAGAPRRGIDAMATKNGPDALRGKPDAHCGQRAVNPSVSQAGVLPGQPEDDLDDAGGNARPLGRSAGRDSWRRSTATSRRSTTTSIASSSASRRKSRTNWR
jgi:hypothetical protein